MMKFRNFLFVSIIVFSVCSVLAQSKKIDLAKKIADATPDALPQSPVAEKPTSDAQDENLKGKVKSITEYTQEGGKTVRQLSSNEYYNEQGNLIKSIEYEDGFPSNVTVWGYIDGNRVLSSKMIPYEENERPPSDRLIISQSAEASSLYPSAPRDRRYNIKNIYKYDEQGRLKEKWQYQNNGEVWTHLAYNYKGSQREELDYDQRGSEISQTIEIFDKDGNIIERDLMDENGKVGDREINTYKFDSQGNWIEKQTSEPKKVKGKVVLNPLWRSYRTIAYYQ